MKEGEQLAFGEVASAGCAAQPPRLRQAGFTGHSPIKLFDCLPTDHTVVCVQPLPHFAEIGDVAAGRDARLGFEGFLGRLSL